MPIGIFSLENLIYLAVLAAAFTVTLCFTPLTKLIAKKTGALDIPDGERKTHIKPTPRLGGIAIAMGFVVAELVFSFIISGNPSKEALALVAGGVLICFIGALDDIYDLPALVKLLAQTAVAVMTAFFGGSIEHITLFGKTFVFGAWAIPVTAVWIVLVVNAVNLIDGLDGLACGVSCLSSFSILIIALMMGDAGSAVAAAALCGAALGFFPFNANPAAVFMGDSGSMLFGYVLAGLSVFGLFKGATLISAVAPALIFALPLVDGVCAFFYRVAKKRNPFKGDRSHLHYKLVDMGFTQRQTVAVIYISTALLCAASIISLRYRAAAVTVAVVVCLFLELLKHSDKIVSDRIKSSSDKKNGEKPVPYDASIPNNDKNKPDTI